MLLEILLLSEKFSSVPFMASNPDISQQSQIQHSNRIESGHEEDTNKIALCGPHMQHAVIHQYTRLGDTKSELRNFTESFHKLHYSQFSRFVESWSPVRALQMRLHLRLITHRDSESPEGVTSSHKAICGRWWLQHTWPQAWSRKR